MDTNKLLDEVRKDNLMADAGYREKASSLTPAAEGAFKGALASGLASRFLTNRSAKKEAGLLAGGIILGGGIANHIHDNKVRLRSQAKKELSKNSSIIDKDHIASDLAIGAGLGGGINAAAPGYMKKARGKWGLVGLGTGIIGGLAGNIAMKNVHGKDEAGSTGKNMAMVGAASGLVEGGITPTYHKVVGYRNRHDPKFKQGVKEAIPSSKRFMGKLFGEDSDFKMLHKGNKTSNAKHLLNKSLAKETLRNSLKRGGVGGLVGLGIGSAIDHFTKR